MSTRSELVWLAGLALAPATAGAQPIPVGAEFAINTYTLHTQTNVTLAAGEDGDFVAVWDSDYHQDGSLTGIFAQRFSRMGQRQGPEFRVNTYTVDEQLGPRAAAEANGDFVVIWNSKSQDGSGTGVFGRRFSSSGAFRGPEFQVNVYSIAYQQLADVGMDADGDFVVVWCGGTQDGDSANVFGRRFDSSGTALGTDFLVNTHTTGDQCFPRVASDADGDFVVVWYGSSYEQATRPGIFAQRFSSVGAQSGAEFEVSTYTLSYLQFAAIASSSGGDFVIAWDSAYDGSYGDGSSRGVFAQRFSSAGQRLGAAFQANTYTLSDQRGAEIAIRDNGDFVIAWTGQHEEYFIPKAYARVFSSTGVGLATEFSVNAYTPLNKFGPSIAIGEEGEFVMAWSSYRQDGYRSSVFGRRFAFPIELDVDGDGETDALTDGLLVLRHLFGISGATLVAGAVDTASCSRCSAESVGAALDALHPVLDADGDGELTALTDGLLVLRYLFGLRGAALINGAVDADCTRCDAPSIEAYLEPLAT